MSIVKQISLFALAAVLCTSCKDTSKDGNIETGTDSTVTDSTQVKETAATLEKTSFKIDGMTCAIGCAKTIQNKLAGLEGVEDAKVDFETKEATISFDPAQQTPETLVETVEHIADGAYKVSDVKSSGDKAYYHADQEKEKEKKKSKKGSASTTKRDESKKAGCCSADAKTEKKGGCCSADKKAGSL
jgi:mercuric ion binding protein